MHSKSFIISAALLASSSSVLSAPIPDSYSAAQLGAREAVVNALTGIVSSPGNLHNGIPGSLLGGHGAGLEYLERRGVGSTIVGDLGQVAEAGIGSLITGVATSAIESILQKLFAKRALSDLSDDEVIALLQHVGDLQNGSSESSKRALADLSDDEVITLLQHISALQNGNGNATRGLEARGSLGSLLSSLSGGSIEKLIKGVLVGLTGGSAQRRSIGSSVAKSPPSFSLESILKTLFAKRALADLSDDEVVTLLQHISNLQNGTGNAARDLEARGGLGSLLSSLFGGSIENLIKGVLGAVTSSSVPSQRRRALSDLTDEEVIALLQQASDVETGKHKREMSLNEVD